ncbi:transposase [Actinomadura namibiensis]|uniref:Transposase n=1 Tax=Actinomadura namibiensis TaxID=182080 RepID=A0A7W3M0I2_ACTNM|nr:hypothetical protein [Actinomadura namibiensis]MBA8957738.1 transposase [Actinomadura namibiensis]
MGNERLKRHDLTDEEWARLAPLLPAQNVHGARHAPAVDIAQKGPVKITSG